jgi:TRAP-type C4-dicarboxylate transport system substrate-binding protein
MNRPSAFSFTTGGPQFLAALLLMLWAGSPLAAAGKINVKLGTLAPRGTSYHKTLMTMGEKWRNASGGTVKLVVFPDGTQGGEADMVALMQTGSLDAGMLTAVGLSEIEKGVTALGGMPMAFRSLDEVDYVNDKLQGTLEKRMLDKGFVVLFWGDSGFVRFFSKKPLVRPDDLRRAKFFCWAGNADEYDLWKSAGYNPIALETVNIMPSLQTGLIDTVAMPPFFALASQIDTQAPHMLLLNWGPLVGAAVVTRKTWDKIPADIRPALQQAAAEAGRDIKAAGRAENDRSVEALKKRGVKVTVPTPEIEAEWRKSVDAYRDKIRGRLVPADLFDEVMRLLQEYRSRPGAAGR